MASLVVAAMLCSLQAQSASHELTLPRPAGYALAGVLEIPAAPERPAVVVLIGGAGPDTRDAGTIRTSRGSNRTFAVLSDSLRARGLAVLRVDEMGTGASSGDYHRRATTSTLAEDVRAWVTALRADPRVDGTRVALLGFSEGATIAAAVAARSEAVVAVVALAAPARPGAAIMSYQDSIALDVHASLSASARTEARARDSTARTATHSARFAAEPWYREFLTLEPLDAWRDVRVPTLLIHGARDQQVPPEDAARIRAALAGRSCVTLVVNDELGHTLVADSWARAPAALDPSVMTVLVDWLARMTADPCAQRNDACCR